MDAKSLKTREPKPPKHPTLRELILSLTDRVGNIETLLDEVGKDIKGIHARIDNLVKVNNLRE